jgi:hypothetical protein
VLSAMVRSFAMEGGGRAAPSDLERDLQPLGAVTSPKGVGQHCQPPLYLSIGNFTRAVCAMTHRNGERRIAQRVMRSTSSRRG